MNRLILFICVVALAGCSTPGGSGWGFHPSGSRFERTITASGGSVPIAKAMAANEPMLATHFLQKLQEWVSGSRADLTICDYSFTVTEDRRAVKYVVNGRSYVDKLDPQQSIRIHELEKSCGYTGRGQRRVSSTQWRRM